jgi:hypothetical protein
MKTGGMRRAGAPLVAMLWLLGLSAVHVHAHGRLTKVAWTAPKDDSVKSSSTPQPVVRAPRTQATQQSTRREMTPQTCEPHALECTLQA